MFCHTYLLGVLAVPNPPPPSPWSEDVACALSGRKVWARLHVQEMPADVGCQVGGVYVWGGLMPSICREIAAAARSQNQMPGHGYTFLYRPYSYSPVAIADKVKHFFRCGSRDHSNVSQLGHFHPHAPRDVAVPHTSEPRGAAVWIHFYKDKPRINNPLIPHL